MNLVLHFDINGTIIPNDSTEHGTDEENANMVISKSVYGKIIDGIWVLNQSYRNPTNAISYYDYLKLVKEPFYKKKSFTFTETGNPGEPVQHLVKPVIEAMASFFFRSFLNALEAYPQAKIVFRTFGLDGEEVITRLKTMYPDRFGEVTVGRFHYENGVPILTTTDQIYCGMEQVNLLIKTSPNNLLFIENYEYWNSHQRAVDKGKQMLGDIDMLQIFFDDNTCVHILNGQNAHYRQVNTLDALFNPDYFNATMSHSLCASATLCAAKCRIARQSDSECASAH